LVTLLAVFRNDVPRSHRAALVAAVSLAVGAFLAARFAMEPKNSVIFVEKAVPIAPAWLDRIVIQARIVVCYWRNIAWPSALCADYGPDSIRGFDDGASIVLLLGLLGAQVFWALRSRLFLLGAVVFWVALLPVSNLVPIFRPMADRYLYLPLTGAAMMCAALLARIAGRVCETAGGRVDREFPPSGADGLEGVRWIAPLAVSLAILLLSVKCLAQQRVWHDSFALWTATAAVNPGSNTAANNLAFEHYNRGEMQASLESAQRAVAMRQGRHADDFAIAALALDGLGRREEADAAFRSAVALDAAYADPDKLVERLTWSRKLADDLKTISRRNSGDIQ
jgi:hypothetical protein